MCGVSWRGMRALLLLLLAAAGGGAGGGAAASDAGEHGGLLPVLYMSPTYQFILSTSFGQTRCNDHCGLTGRNQRKTIQMLVQ